MLVERLKLQNILSFGPDPVELELKPLNVLIGPNGAGKSNLIEIIDLLRCAPSDISRPISKGGGVSQWIRQGKPEASSAKVEVVANPTGEQALRYAFEFAGIEHRFKIIRERLEDAPADGQTPRPFFDRQEDRAELYQEVVNLKVSDSLVPAAADSMERAGELKPTDYSITDPRKAFLAEIREPSKYPEQAHLEDGLGRIKIYREWSFGRNMPLRQPQQADLRNDFLSADATNLGLVLSRLRRKPAAKRKVLDVLRRLYGGITDYDIVIEGGAAQILVEEGDISVPATRLSDGTLRFLCLLAILCDTAPPPLVCVEEPELGLHPDALALLADLFVEASERTQLIVTTHSEALVGALTNQPDAIVVCERPGASTELRRLDPHQLSTWLKDDYGLGDLWRMGALGANP